MTAFLLNGHTKMKTMRAILFAAFVFLSIPALLGAEDILIADFEAATYGDWKTTGEAFGPGPARGTLPGQMRVDGFKGRGRVNSFFKGDGSTGTLTSPEFKIERRYISFLIGGGKASLGDIGLTDLPEAHGRWRLTDERSFAPDRLEVYERLRAQ